MRTKKNEVTGVFSMQGISNKSGFIVKIMEEARVRLHNIQNLFYVILLVLLHSLNHLYNKFIKI